MLEKKRVYCAMCYKTRKTLYAR